MWPIVPAVTATLLLPWRPDGLCGPQYTAPDGTLPARCDPWDAAGRTCCSRGGSCVVPMAATTAGAADNSSLSSSDSCDVDYAIRRPWRSDGQCGEDMPGADGTDPSACNPLHARNLTCCSDAGWCGAWPSWEHCRCRGCVNHFTACVCDAASPCQDPASGRCYPRTAAAAESDLAVPHTRQGADPSSQQLDSQGRPIDARHLAARHDRRPEQDPRKSMKDVALMKRFDKRFKEADDETDGGFTPAQRPTVDGARCAYGLVDCSRGGAERAPLTMRSTISNTDANADAVPDSNAAVAANAPAASTSDAAVSGGGDGGGGGDDADAGGGGGDDADAGGGATAAPTTDPPQTPPRPAPSPPPLVPLQLRLAAGARPREGRLEVLHNGSWGTVCSKGWGWTSAYVACRSLGFGGVDAVLSGGSYGRGVGPIHLSHVRCQGTEPGLERCQYYGLGVSTVPPSCTHQLDAGLHCSEAPMPVPVADPAQPAPGTRIRRVSEGGRNGSPAGTLDDLGSVLDDLEGTIEALESTRPLIDSAHLARLTRLRLRLHRLAGRPADPPPVCDANGSGQSAATAETATSQSRSADGGGASGGAGDDDDYEELDDDRALGISPSMASRLPAAMLEELRRVPRRGKALEESRREFEREREAAAYDPLADDAVVRKLREREGNYVLPESQRPPPVDGSKPHERLRKPPIQSLVNRRPPSWEEAHKARREHTLEQIRLGLAPEGIMRTLGPGPWDTDPGFWRDSHDRDVGHLEHELDDDIIFES